jgi:myo-inositol-1(or 4)-monophosphatase
MLPDLAELQDLVKEEAERELLPRFADVLRIRKPDRSIVTEADVRMQQALAEVLAERWPQYPLLGEEMDAQEQERLLAASGAGLWCLDPLDGTTNFAAGIPFFSVSLCLLVEGSPVLGVVYDPVRTECFAARKGHGATLNSAPLRAAPSGLALADAIAAVDFKRLAPPLGRRLAEQPPYASQRNLGSAALDWCWVAAGRFQVYLHGGQRLWDYAAGSLILEEAGGHAISLDGAPVYRLGLQPRSVVVALEARIFEDWRAWVTASGRVARPSVRGPTASRS